jgi:hypothetical protein
LFISSSSTTDNRCGEVCHTGEMILGPSLPFPPPSHLAGFSPLTTSRKTSDSVRRTLFLVPHHSALVPALVLETSDFGHRTADSMSRHSSLLLNNHLSFHQHNGKTPVTVFVFINIMERPISDIFTTCVFNNIMEDTFIFSPRVFSLPCHPE